MGVFPAGCEEGILVGVLGNRANKAALNFYSSPSWSNPLPLHTHTHALTHTHIYTGTWISLYPAKQVEDEGQDLE